MHPPETRMDPRFFKNPFLALTSHSGGQAACPPHKGVDSLAAPGPHLDHLRTDALPWTSRRLVHLRLPPKPVFKKTTNSRTQLLAAAAVSPPRVEGAGGLAGEVWTREVPN